MKYLVVGDIHVKSGNIADIMQLMDFVVETIDTHPSIDGVVLLGDILDYHEKVLTPCLNIAYTFISRVSSMRQVYVLVGNHDYVSNSQFLTDSHWMNGMKQWHNVTIVDSVISKGGATFCPYVPPGRLEEALGTCPKHKPGNVVFCHQEFRGCDMGSVRSETGDDYSRLSLAVSGHIHDNQWLSTCVYYVGAPLQHAFGDKEKRVIAIVDTETKSVVEVPVSIGKKVLLTATCDGVSEAYISAIPEGASVRVALTGTLSECKAFKKSALYKKLGKKAKIVFTTVNEAGATCSAHKVSFIDRVKSRITGDNAKTELENLLEKIMKQ
jgi:DNA repair exonuclease SbcCD nuclease subunit